MPPVIWSTADLAATQALQRWREVIDESLMALDISSPTEGFQARIEQGALGPMQISKLTAGPQSVQRTRRGIARHRDRPKLDIVAVRTGVFRYAQNGHEQILRPGDCAVLDRTSPYRFTASASCSMTLALEHDWLARWTADPGALAGQRIDGARGWGRALSAMLATLEVDMIDDLALPGGVLAEQIASLTVLACTSAAGARAGEGERRQDRALAAHLRQLVADRAHDPEFDVAAAARALGISRRSLHLLCARMGSSFGRMLMTQRLERARAMLADRRGGDVPIGEIAYRCGFLDPGHFSKRFRAHFGATPSALRQDLHA